MAAVAYAVLAGGSSSSRPTGPAPKSAVPAGISVTESNANPAESVAETTSGASVQRHGFAHDPFAALPGAVKLTSTATATSNTISSSTTTSGGSSTGSESGSGSTSTGQSESTPTSKSTTPKKKKKAVYETAVLFGEVPPGTPAASATLTPYDNLKLMTAFPSAQLPLVVFRGVTAGGKSASFTIVGEVILHGNAACLPSAMQCQEINLKPGQSEQLEYLAGTGQVVTYELRIVSIVEKQAAAASASRVRAHLSRAGRRVLESAGLTEVPGLRFSAIAGVVTSVPRAVVRASAW